MRSMGKKPRKQLSPKALFLISELSKGPKTIRQLTDLVFEHVGETSEKEINGLVSILSKRRLIKKSQIIRKTIAKYNVPTRSNPGKSRGKYESKAMVVFPKMNRRF